MALLDKLTLQGSTYSYGNGQTPPINPGATQQSKMHADGNTPGYSISGNDFGDVNSAYLSYNDGAGNTLPMPSVLDLNNGATPSTYSQTGPTEGHY